MNFFLNIHHHRPNVSFYYTQLILLFLTKGDDIRYKIY